MRHIVRGEKELNKLAALVTNLAPDRKWVISISHYNATRSGAQNDRLHAILAAIAAETGNDPKTLKEWAKDQFGPIVTIEVDGKAYEIPKPTHMYDVAEMSTFMDRIEAWAASELGVCA